MSSGMRRHVQLATVLGLCATGMASAPGTPDADTAASLAATGDVIKDCLARPFAAGKYEVTFAQWDACVAGGGCAHVPDGHSPR
jgi:formylglycine-generating enzyme required for sulfatase activity